MNRRKRIGLFTAYPETTHARRILEGVMCQCERYNYDLFVFASSVHLSFPHDRYVQGEANIYQLANFDELDGIILDSVSLIGDPENRTLKKLASRLARCEKLPVCTLEYPVERIPLIPNNNEESIREQCRHAIEVHGRTRLCILTGPEGNEIAESRLALYLDEIGKHGLEVLPEHIVYGDFYYFSGDALAKKIAGHEISCPDAVVCASDYMAMGLVDRLDRLGVRVPEEVLVIGFDSSDEGAINLTTVASFEPADVEMGANAVDYLRAAIDPEAELIPYIRDASARFHAGASCGCRTDPAYMIMNFRNSLYISTYNKADEEQNDRVGLGTFMESYVMEGFTAAKSPGECIQHIYNYADLLRPYRNFYLCLKENWKDMDDELYEGYPEKMQLCVASSRVGDTAFCREQDAVTFRTGKMLPCLERSEDKASVFYFSPVHFDGALLGFTVLQRELCTQPVINVVYRNWLRYINNALEMARSKDRLEILSVRDAMTGAYNRRGMYEMYKSMLSEARESDSLFVSVVDMDGLKYVNDTFGHAEGDFGIITVCNVLMSVAKSNEICVRSGGDEFFLIGIGSYTREDEAARAMEFREAVAKASESAGKPYPLSASIGCAVFSDCRKISLDNALSETDERMYRYKVKNRQHRGI